MSSDEVLLRTAVELAWQARARGNHPFGALLALDGVVILTAENTVNSEHDVTRHAELNLVSAASRRFDGATLARTTLFTSTEPCAMCAGAIFWAGIPRVVFGCAAATLGALAGGLFVVPSRALLAYGTRPTEVIGPLLETEAVAVHEGFWDV